MLRNVMHAAGGVVLASLIMLATGCAQEIGDIDRTQPNKIKKALFQDKKEWYYRQTVVDTDAQGSVIFEGYQSGLKRVRWVVTERVLYACSTTPVVEGEVIEEDLPGEECYGFVAAFPIMGHFDVQRAYNTATGEQTNLLVENYSDRPWFDRDYMRVDWSRNLVSGFRLFQGQLGRFASASWDVPIDDNYVEVDRARIDNDYIETTSMYTYQPDIYACFYSFGDIYNCEGGEIRVRNSFTPVPEKKEFEPFLHLDRQFVTKDGTFGGERLMVTNLFDPDTGLLSQVECTPEVETQLLENNGDFAAERCQPLTFEYFNQFGFFRTENGRLDTWRSVPEDNRLYYANHWNIWETAYDDEGNLLDMSERKVRPITYHLNEEYPRDMITPALEVGRQWDEAFLESAALAKGVSVDEIRAELTERDGDPRMFRIVENNCMPSKLAGWVEGPSGAFKTGDRSLRGFENVKELVGDYAGKGSGASLEDRLWSLPLAARRQMCAEVEWMTELRDSDSFTYARAGDVRKSFFYWVEEYNNYWSGYGPSSADPQTGEIISGTAHIAGTTLRMSAAYAADLVKYMNGEFSAEEIQFGDQVRRYLETQRNRTTETMRQALTPEGKREFTRRALSDTDLSVDDISPSRFNSQPRTADLPEIIREKGMKAVSQDATRMVQAATEAKRLDTRFADFMTRPEVKSLMMADPNTAYTVKAMAIANAFGEENLTQEHIDNAYLEFQAPELAYYRSNRSDKFFSEQNIYTRSNMDRAAETLITYAGVAEAFKGREHAEIAKYFLDQMMIGTQLHEVGHTVGLRHNFSASLDALNYQDEFWKVRKAIAEGRISEADANKITDPALVAEITDKPGATYVNEAEFRLGSIMDYTGDITARFGGLGKYDQAAINFVYAHKVQQWKPEILAQLPNGLANSLFLTNYKDLPKVFSGLDATADPNMRELQGIDNILNGREWVSLKAMKETTRLNVLANTSDLKNKAFSRDNPPRQSPRIPYNFCTDDRRDFQLGCDVFDWGSSQREIVNQSFNTYRQFQDFWRYSRHNTNRYFQNINGYYGRLFRTFGVIARPFRFYSIYRIWDLGSYTDDLREAAIDAANFYSEILTMPEPGRFCKAGQLLENERLDENWYFNLDNTYLPAGFNFNAGLCDEYIDLRPGMAQYYNYDFTDEYSWRIRYVGTFVDKIVAVQSLFNVSANFLFNQFLTDTRATNVTYWTLFRDEMLGQIRGMVLNDYRQYGGVYDAKTAEYKPQNMVDRNKFTFGTPDPQEGQPRIFSILSFNHEFNMMAFSMIANSTWADRSVDFSHYMKIAVDNTEVQELGDAEIAEFIHPVTNQRYMAPNTSDGKSLSYDMVQWANRLKNRWLDSVDDMDNKKAIYDQLREAYDANFNPLDCEDTTRQQNDADLGAVCQAMLEFDLSRDAQNNRSEQLNDVVAKLDQVRFLWKALGSSVLR